MAADMDELAKGLLERTLTRALERADESDKEALEALRSRREQTDMAALEERRARTWERLLDLAERVCDRILEPPTARALKEAAASSPPPRRETNKAETVLQAIASQPPPVEAAEILRDAGVTEDNLSTVLAQVREASPEWAAWLDEHEAWVKDVEHALKRAAA